MSDFEDILTKRNEVVAASVQEILEKKDIRIEARLFLLAHQILGELEDIGLKLDRISDDIPSLNNN